MTQLPFSCICGSVKGMLAHATAQGGNHIVCFCQSCRAAHIYCGGDDPAPEPVDLFQTTGDNITITQGQDNLVPFAFGPKNLLRWKATCCGAQFFSTPRNPAISIVGVVTARLETKETIGPIRSRAFVPKDDGKVGHEKIGGFVKMVARALGKRLSGGWKKTPLFDPNTKLPIAEVLLISREEKRALLNQS